MKFLEVLALLLFAALGADINDDPPSRAQKQMKDGQ